MYPGTDVMFKLSHVCVHHPCPGPLYMKFNHGSANHVPMLTLLASFVMAIISFSLLAWGNKGADSADHQDTPWILFYFSFWHCLQPWPLPLALAFYIGVITVKRLGYFCLNLLQCNESSQQLQMLLVCVQQIWSNENLWLWYSRRYYFIIFGIFMIFHLHYRLFWCLCVYFKF